MNLPDHSFPQSFFELAEKASMNAEFINDERRVPSNTTKRYSVAR